jgi:hypothetical protein
MRLIVDLVDTAQPTTGWVESEDGCRREFVGIIELIALLSAGAETASEVPTNDW